MCAGHTQICRGCAAILFACLVAAVIDSYTLTTALEAEATLSTAVNSKPVEPKASVGPILGHKADNSAAGAAGGVKSGPAGAQHGSAATATGADDGGVVKCHYERELVLVDTLNKQATFK